MEDVGAYFGLEIDADGLPGYSLYHDQQLRKRWVDLCSCDAETPVACTCAIGSPDDEDE